jgi:hypothetical protein
MFFYVLFLSSIITMTSIPTTEKEQLIDLICHFICQRGMVVAEGITASDTFFPGIAIKNGELIIDRQQLLYPGDLLHEAGHIAVAPPEDRCKLNDNVTSERPGSEGEEMSVMLWTYAACLELGISPTVVFHAEGYKGDSQWIVDQYKAGNFIGLPLLVWMGLAKDATAPGGFPTMLKWMRE